MNIPETTIVNRHHGLTFDQYIGRGTKWGNPFSHMETTSARYKVSSREEAIACYKSWVMKQSRLMNSLHELWGLALGCSCKPQGCHGDVLIDLINQKFEGQIPYRIIIAGGRDFKDYNLLSEKMNELLQNKKENHQIIIVSGTAKGADQLGERYARKNGLLVHRMPANWQKNGQSAGYLRNADMAKISQECICFWNEESKGTKHMIDLAEAKTLPTRVFNY